MAVALPATREEVVALVKWARDNDVVVVPRGAGTGLSGGAVAIRGGLMIGFARMKKILSLDIENQRAVVQPGVVNLDLSAEVAAGRFRQDLFYRLNVIQIRVPPLRERKDDIPELARTLIARFLKRRDVPDSMLSPDTIAVLKQHDWPGNVRQLEGVIERAVIACDGDTIEPRHLPRGVAGSAGVTDQPIPRSNAEFVALKKNYLNL